MTAYPYRWRLAEFVAAWDAGAFDSRVELVDGYVWAVPVGRWHGDTAARLLRALDRHAGHADIVRELIDGSAGLRDGNDHLAPGDQAWWDNYRSRLERVAEGAGRG